MKRLSTLVLLILSLAIQSASARVVKGRVFSSADTTVVVGADCRLMSGDRMVNSWRSNADGSFAVASGDKGSLRLEVEKHGFSTTEILIKGGSDDVDLGPVFLEKSVELKEVSVTANQVVYTKGRTIVYPSVSEVKASSTSIELFQKLPLAGLTVNPIFRPRPSQRGQRVFALHPGALCRQGRQRLYRHHTQEARRRRQRLCLRPQRGQHGLCRRQYQRFLSPGTFAVFLVLQSLMA